MSTKFSHVLRLKIMKLSHVIHEIKETANSTSSGVKLIIVLWFFKWFFTTQQQLDPDQAVNYHQVSAVTKKIVRIQNLSLAQIIFLYLV